MCTGSSAPDWPDPNPATLTETESKVISRGKSLQENRRLRVAMLCNLPHPSVGGMQKQALTLANALVDQGVEISFLSKRDTAQRRAYAAYWDEQGRLQRVKLIQLPAFSRRPGWSLFCSFMGWAVTHRHRFQILHAHNPPLGLMACLVGWLTCTPVVVKLPSHRHLGYLQGNSPSHRLRRWILTRHVDCFIAVSAEMAQALTMFGIPSERIALIPNGVEISPPATSHERVSLRHKLLPQPDTGVVLAVGRLVEEKGVDRLLRVWAAMRPERAVLLIVGGGPLREPLEAMARGLNLMESVRFLGHQDEVAQFYAMADIFVLPSMTEGMSNALLEAMAAGLPVVASPVGGNNDVIEGRHSGFLVDWDNTDACVHVLKTLLADRYLRHTLGASAQKRVADFGIVRVAERYRQLYLALLRGKDASCRD